MFPQICSLVIPVYNLLAQQVYAIERSHDVQMRLHIPIFIPEIFMLNETLYNGSLYLLILTLDAVNCWC